MKPAPIVNGMYSDLAFEMSDEYAFGSARWEAISLPNNSIVALPAGDVGSRTSGAGDGPGVIDGHVPAMSFLAAKAVAVGIDSLIRDDRCNDIVHASLRSRIIGIETKSRELELH